MVSSEGKERKETFSSCVGEELETVRIVHGFRYSSLTVAPEKKGKDVPEMILRRFGGGKKGDWESRKVTEKKGGSHAEGGKGVAIVGKSLIRGGPITYTEVRG